MINMDFSQRVVVETAQAPWVASPASGVWRKPLEKAQAELAGRPASCAMMLVQPLRRINTQWAKKFWYSKAFFLTKRVITPRAVIYAIHQTANTRLLAKKGACCL